MMYTDEIAAVKIAVRERRKTGDIEAGLSKSFQVAHKAPNKRYQLDN
mgnify:CR=1 FL=1